MKYRFGSNILKQHKTETKALMQQARFDPNAEDGDGDGFVQEGTRFRRPAPRRAVSRVTGKIKGRISGSTGKYGIASNKNVKTFNGMDHQHVLEAVGSIIDSVEKKYGKITTVKEAVDALKTVFGKVQIFHMGPNTGRDGKSSLTDSLTQSESAVIAALLFAFNGMPELKKRRLVLSHEISDGAFSGNGSTGVLRKTNAKGGPDFPEFGVRVNIPFNENLASEILDENNTTNIDGVSNQLTKALLVHAQSLPPGGEKDAYERAAFVSSFMGVTVHEAIHALDLPRNGDRLNEELLKRNPNLTTEEQMERARLLESNSEEFFIKNYLISKSLQNIQASEAGVAILMSQSYEEDSEEDFLSTAALQISQLESVKQELNQQIKEIQDAANDPNASFLDIFTASAVIPDIQEAISRIDLRINRVDKIQKDLTEKIAKGRQQDSLIAKLRDVVYRDGLNYLFDIAPPGHPGHNKDVDMTVDAFGNEIPTLDINGKKTKVNNATWEFAKSMLFAFKKSPDFRVEAERAGFSLADVEDDLDNIYISKDANGKDFFDFNKIKSNVGQDTLDSMIESIAQLNTVSKMSSHWPPDIEDREKWEIVDWMKMISQYGSLSHFRYRNGTDKPSKDNIISVEVTAELITSLIFGAGAARVPMSPQVRSGVIKMLNWVYAGDSWKSMLPEISLKALGIK